MHSGMPHVHLKAGAAGAGAAAEEEEEEKEGLFASTAEGEGASNGELVAFWSGWLHSTHHTRALAPRCRMQESPTTWLCSLRRTPPHTCCSPHRQLHCTTSNTAQSEIPTTCRAKQRSGVKGDEKKSQKPQVREEKRNAADENRLQRRKEPRRITKTKLQTGSGAGV